MRATAAGRSESTSCALMRTTPSPARCSLRSRLASAWRARAWIGPSTSMMSLMVGATKSAMKRPSSGTWRRKVTPSWRALSADRGGLRIPFGLSGAGERRARGAFEPCAVRMNENALSLHLRRRAGRSPRRRLRDAPPPYCVVNRRRGAERAPLAEGGTPPEVEARRCITHKGYRISA